MDLLADTITPVITASWVYLFLLNALIGILEGKLLRRWFPGGRRAVWWMILANYLSAWIGLIVLNWILQPRLTSFLGARPIERVNLLAGVCVFMSFAVSVLIEAGFVHLAMERGRRSLGLTLLASLCVNSISYLIIAFWFMWVSYTLPLNASVANLADIGPLPRGMLYWVDPTGQVMARPLDRSETPRHIGQVMKNDFIWPNQLRISSNEDSRRVHIDTMYSFTRYADRPTPPNLVAPDPLLLADAGPVDAFPDDYWTQSRTLRKSTLDLRSPEHRQTDVDFDWYRHRLNVSVPGGASSRLCIGWVMLDWEIQEPTVLPDDKIVFEWAGQILIFDPRTKKLAFIALGTCPAVVPGG